MAGFGGAPMAKRAIMSHLSPTSPLLTPKSKIRSEVSVKFGIYKGNVEIVFAVYPLYNRGKVNSGRIYIGR